MTPNNLLERLQNAIGQANADADFERLMVLTKKAQRVRELADELKRLEAETDTLMAPIGHNASPPDAPSRATSQRTDLENIFWLPPLAIVFRREGKTPVYIAERKASDSMRRLIEVLAEHLGSEVLEKLSRLGVNRGKIVSDNPERDFRNRARGTVYQHQQINGTGYAVMTNNSTEEKLGVVELIRQGAGLKPGELQAFSEKRMPDDIKRAVGLSM